MTNGYHFIFREMTGAPLSVANLYEDITLSFADFSKVGDTGKMTLA